MTITRLRIALLALGSVLALPAEVRAQLAPDSIDMARFHFGPVGLTPRLAIQNLGIDTNVFNSAVDPVQDTTGTIAPGVDLWLRAGRLLFSSKTTAELNYYQQATSQRAFNIGETWRIDVDLVYARPRLAGHYVNTRQRPNDEIDARVQQKHVAAGGGITVPIGARVSVDADARRTRYDFSEGEYGSFGIAFALNRDSDQAALVTSVALTPLTSIALRADTSRDRFVYSPERDSDSVRVMPGVTFQPSALVSGSAFVGVRRFVTVSPLVPDYSGVVAAVELKYIAMDMLRVTGHVKRDVDYSLDLTEPFFVSTSVGVEVLQAIGSNWDIVGRARRGLLTYMQTGVGLPGRTDNVRTAGLGVGRRLGEELRVGLDVDYVARTSILLTRTYEGLRIGGSFTYGY